MLQFCAKVQNVRYIQLLTYKYVGILTKRKENQLFLNKKKRFRMNGRLGRSEKAQKDNHIKEKLI